MATYQEFFSLQISDLPWASLLVLVIQKLRVSSAAFSTSWPSLQPPHLPFPTMNQINMQPCEKSSTALLI